MKWASVGCCHSHSTSLQLARLVERITRNFGERRLTGAVFLDVAKTFDTVWIEGLLYKLTVLNFPSYPCTHHFLIPSGSDVRGVLPNSHVITSRHAGWGGTGWVDLSCPLQSVCQRHAQTLTPRRVGPYADDTAIIATSRTPVLLVATCNHISAILNGG